MIWDRRKERNLS